MDDDFFNQSIYPLCKWCNEEIKIAAVHATRLPNFVHAVPVSSIQHSKDSISIDKYDTIYSSLPFCDVACAKLYNDNVERVKFDFLEYYRLFELGKLSDKGRSIYTKCRNDVFEQLPTYTINKALGMNNADIKSEYVKLFLC